MGKPVTIEAYASMRAELEEGMLRDEVLARAELSVEEWTQTQREWLEKMGAELDCGRFELTNRYGQAFLDRQQALSEAAQAANAQSAAPAPAVAPPPADAPGPPMPDASWATPPAGTPQTPPVAPVQSMNRPAPPPAVPVAAVDEPERPSPVTESVPPAADPGQTTFGVVLPREKALPFDGSKASSMPPRTQASGDESDGAPPAAEIAQLDAKPGGTMFGAVLPRGKALPFDGSKASAEPRPKGASEDESERPSPVTESVPPAADPGETTFGVVLPREKALPFDGAKTSSIPPPLQTSEDDPDGAPPTTESALLAADPSKTRYGVMLSDVNALPFDGAKAGSKGRLPQASDGPPAGGSTAASSTPPVPAQSDGALGQTLPVGATSPLQQILPVAAANAAAASPPPEATADQARGLSGDAQPRRPSSSPPPSLPMPSLKQLAAVTVELSFTSNEAEVLRRYGLTEQSRRAAFADLEERCRKDPAVRAAWIEACSVYREWREKQGGR